MTGVKSAARRLQRGVLTAFLGMAILAAGCSGAAPKPSAGGADSKPQASQPAQAQPAQPQPAQPAQPATPAKKDKVVIGNLPVATNVGLFVAEANGYFAKNGIEPEWVQLDTASKATIPLGTGDMHVVGGGGSAGLYNSMAKGVDIEIVADKGKQSIFEGVDTSSVWMGVRTDLWEQGVKSIADLKGKTIGINAKGSASEFQVTAMLKKVGLKITDVKLQQIGFPDMPAAFANKSIDAATMLEPYASIGKQKGYVHLITSTAQNYPDYQSGIILYSGKWAKENPDAANRFMVAYLQGVRDYETARRLGPGTPEFEKMAEIISKYTSSTDVKNVIWAFLDPTGKVNTQSVIDEIQWNADVGAVAQKPDISKVINNQFVEYANKVLGEYKPPKK